MSDFVTPWTAARQAPLSMGFPGQDTRLGCHFLPRVVLQPRTWTCILESPAWGGRFSPPVPPGKPGVGSGACYVAEIWRVPSGLTTDMSEVWLPALLSWGVQGFLPFRLHFLTLYLWLVTTKKMIYRKSCLRNYTWLFICSHCGINIGYTAGVVLRNDLSPRAIDSLMSQEWCNWAEWCVIYEEVSTKNRNRMSP